MRRRKLLGMTLTISVAAIAGCTGDDGTGSQDENGEGETPEGESQEGHGEDETPEDVTQTYVQASIEGDIDTVRETAYPSVEESLLGTVYAQAHGDTEEGDDLESVQINQIEEMSPHDMAENEDVDDVDSDVERQRENIQEMLDRVNGDNELEEFTYVTAELVFGDESGEEEEEILYTLIKTTSTEGWKILTRS